MAALELYEIEDEVVARLQAELPDLQVKAADQMLEDRTWLVQVPPACLIHCPGEVEAPPQTQATLDKCKRYRVAIMLYLVMLGTRPRGEFRTVKGNDILPLTRDTLWNYRIPTGVSSSIEYMTTEIESYDEGTGLETWNQMFYVDVTRRPTI